MSSEWKNRRRKLPFYPFEEFKEMQKYINEIIQEALTEHNGVSPRVYILLISEDPNLEMEETERSIRGKNHNRIREEQETLIDVFEDKDKVVVLVEVPNVKKQNIELNLKGNLLTIWINQPERRLIRTVELPAKVNAKEANINTKNRVLEINLPKVKKYTS